MDPGINRGTRKLVRTSQVIKKKKKDVLPNSTKISSKLSEWNVFFLSHLDSLASSSSVNLHAELSCNFCVVFLTVIITCPRVLFIVFLWLIFNIVEYEIKKIR